MGRLARRIRAHWRKRHRKREALRTSREFFKRQHTLRRWRLPKQNSSDITPFTGAPSSRTTPAPQNTACSIVCCRAEKPQMRAAPTPAPPGAGHSPLRRPHRGQARTSRDCLMLAPTRTCVTLSTRKCSPPPHEPPSAPSCWLSCSSRSCSYCRSPQMTGKWRRCITHFSPPPAP